MAIFSAGFEKGLYLVHAQFLTGIMIGIFSVFGHLLLDD